MLNGKTGGAGETIYRALLIGKYNKGDAIKNVLNAKNSID